MLDPLHRDLPGLSAPGLGLPGASCPRLIPGLIIARDAFALVPDTGAVSQSLIRHIAPKVLRRDALFLARPVLTSPCMHPGRHPRRADDRARSAPLLAESACRRSSRHFGAVSSRTLSRRVQMYGMTCQRCIRRRASAIGRRCEQNWLGPTGFNERTLLPGGCGLSR
jgi:hypothetical protein